MNRSNSKGQVWIETVIYTLIGLAVIGLVLAGAMPKINAKKDEIMIGQSIEALSLIDDKIYDIQRAPGNRRSISLDIRSGSFTVDAENDEIFWTLESSFPYSDIGSTTPFGNMNITTNELGAKSWEIILSTKYNFDIRNDDSDISKLELTSAPTPYSLSIENAGKENNRMVINFRNN